MTLEEIAINAFLEAYKHHQLLGKAGEKRKRKNRYGEVALEADIASEEIIINSLRNSGLPLKLVTEEHGELDLSLNPILLGVIDGLDGTNRYLASRNGEDKNAKYGPILGIFSNTNPKYKEYLFSGLIDFSTGRIFYAIKGEGSFVFLPESGHKRIKCSNGQKLKKGSKIYLDRYFDEQSDPKDKLFGKLKKFNVQDARSYVAYHSELASGEVSAVITFTRKGNLEMAGTYGLVKESGGDIFTIDQRSIGEESFFNFGQDGILRPIISAPNKKIAREISNLIRS
ncbi:MAG: inositol monophosphatase family protein [Nanoarchaeota archaeon]|nr:inositol monophosphatase family protein [Nanoarchaeota archaeon]